MHHQSEWGPRSEREPRDEVHILGKNSEPFWPFLDGLYQIRRLLVLNRHKQLVGMVALGDLAVHAGTQPVTAEVLAQVSEPGKAGRK